MERQIKPLGNRRFFLPDGSQRYLVDQSLLDQSSRSAGAAILADPLKTTIVQGQRCMTTWVVRKAP